MNNAVLIVGIGRNKQLQESLLSVKKYCAKFDLALEIVENPKWNFSHQHGYNYKTFEKNQIYDFFEKYDRILRLDSDIIIKPDCPNLFLKKIGKFYVSYEDKNARKGERKKEIELAKESLGNVENWDKGYFNSGVILCDKIHRDAFLIDKNEIYSKDLGPFKEQTYLNWKVRKLNFEVIDLGAKFNYTTVHHGYYDKNKAWLIHYAGKQHTKLFKMKRDNKIFYRKGYWLEISFRFLNLKVNRYIGSFQDGIMWLKHKLKELIT